MADKQRKEEIISPHVQHLGFVQTVSQALEEKFW